MAGPVGKQEAVVISPAANMLPPPPQVPQPEWDDAMRALAALAGKLGAGGMHEHERAKACAGTVPGAGQHPQDPTGDAAAWIDGGAAGVAGAGPPGAAVPPETPRLPPVGSRQRRENPLFALEPEPAAASPSLGGGTMIRVSPTMPANVAEF